MTRIEYTYIIDGKLIQDSTSVEWIAKVNALKYKVKFAEDESSIINKLRTNFSAFYLNKFCISMTREKPKFA